MQLGCFGKRYCHSAMSSARPSKTYTTLCLQVEQLSLQAAQHQQELQAVRHVAQQVEEQLLPLLGPGEGISRLLQCKILQAADSVLRTGPNPAAQAGHPDGSGLQAVAAQLATRHQDLQVCA